MSPPASATCQKCGAPIRRPRGAAWCAACLLAEGLSDADEAGGEGEPFTAASALGRCGKYELIEEIAHGGMGVVFRARDTALNRTVALKMILAGPYASDRERKRFRAEAEAAARLDHPNIVPIYEVGEHDGRPYFAMQFMEGGVLTGILSEPLPEREAAALLVKVARAVHHAHQRAILHRDLKPGNILLDAQGEPHVSDFGLARRLDSADGLTVSGSMVGSPGYMSPEQAAGHSAQLTTASDTYSLGAVLYHLLAGRAPFQASTPLMTLEKVLHEEPAPPRSVRRELDIDLETVCLKCLEKDPARRYASADALAEDLERWQRGEPIHARRITARERVLKWARRKPGMAALAIVATLAVLSFIVGQTVMSARLARANTEVRATVARLNRSLYELRWRQADEASRGEPSESVARFSQFLRENPADQTAAARLLSLLGSMNFPMPVRPPLTQGSPVLALDFHRDGRRLVAGSGDGSVAVWNLASGARESGFTHPAAIKYCLAVGTNDTRLLTVSTEPRARLWDIAGGRLIVNLDLGPFDAMNVAWLPVASRNRERIALHRRTNEVVVLDGGTGSPVAPPVRAPRAITTFDLSPDGRFLATSLGSEVRLWDVASSRPLFMPARVIRPYERLNFSDDSRWLACVARGRAWVMSTVTGAVEREFELDAISSAILENSGELIPLPSAAFTPLRRVDFRTGQDLGSPFELAGFNPRRHPVLSLAMFSARIIEAGWPPRVQLVDPATGLAQSEPFLHDGPVSTARFSPDGRVIATGSPDGTVRLWSGAMNRAAPLRLQPGGAVWEAQWSPSGTRILTSCSDGTKHAWQLWSMEGGEPRMDLSGPLESQSSFGQWSPNGTRVALIHGLFSARIFDARNGEPLSPPLRHENAISHLAFSPDSRILATAANDETVRLWDSADGHPIGMPLRHPQIPLKLSFSSDGRRLATGSLDGTIHVWSVPEGKLLVGPLRHRGICWVAAFSPDDRALVSASSDSTAQLWDARTGAALLPAFQHESPVLWAAFSPDGSAVATCTDSGITRVWETASGRQVSEAMRHPGKTWFVNWSADGRFLATTCTDGAARVWDARSGHLVAEPFAHGGEVRRAVFSPDGRRLLTASFDGTAGVWELGFLRPPVPVPDWLPDLAEAVAGKRIGAKETPITVPGDSFHRVQPRLPQPGDNSGPDNYYSRWVKWMLEERLERPVQPFRP